jgi:hypothetical protein
MSIESRLDIAIRRIETAREYTETLLEGLTEEDWFWQPEGLTTHIAWQVGHLAMAQYGLTLFRQRGRQPIDLDLMSGRFRKQFSRGSSPAASADLSPSVEEIRNVFDRVHAQALAELPTFDEASLDETIDPPYSGFPTKFGALLFAVDHEMLHCGQIGMLRRLMGKEPVR